MQVDSEWSFQDSLGANLEYYSNHLYVFEYIYSSVDILEFHIPTSKDIHSQTQDKEFPYSPWGCRLTTSEAGMIFCLSTKYK